MALFWDLLRVTASYQWQARVLKMEPNPLFPALVGPLPGCLGRVPRHKTVS
jgi:hypothetical protein